MLWYHGSTSNNNYRLPVRDNYHENKDNDVTTVTGQSGDEESLNIPQRLPSVDSTCTCQQMPQLPWKQHFVMHQDKVLSTDLNEDYTGPLYDVVCAKPLLSTPESERKSQAEKGIKKLSQQLLKPLSTLNERKWNIQRPCLKDAVNRLVDAAAWFQVAQGTWALTVPF